MTEEGFEKEFEELARPEPWENCLVELEQFIFGSSNLANRYTAHELVAALFYLSESQGWKANNLGKEHEWIESLECEGVVQQAFTISQIGKEEA